MTANGHRLAGIGVALIAASTSVSPILAGLSALFACTAPDWLEISSRNDDGVRSSVIPHRTFTHWVPMWIAIAYLGYDIGFVYGFALGALGHCLTDFLTPMGVPILPWKRSSLRLVKNPYHELIVVIVIGLFASILFWYRFLLN